MSISDDITQELAWREPELSLAKLYLFRELHDNVRFRFSYRSFVALSYAHYEGFTKTVATLLLDNIKSFSCRPSECRSDIRESMLAPALRKEINKLSNREIVGHKLSSALDNVQFPGDKFYLGISNLDPPTLDWLLTSLGFSPTDFLQYRPHIARMVYLRHQCAHGEAINFDASKKNIDVYNSVATDQEALLTFMHDFGVKAIDWVDSAQFFDPLGAT